MALISTTIPNLIGGVSQQPNSVRLVSQCDSMENCFPSVVEFLRRRPATKHIAKIMGGAVKDASVHVIDRDSHEQYIVVATDGNISIFDLFGKKKTVTFKADTAYLATKAANTDIAFLTINDYTFVLNKTITTSMLPTTSTQRTPEALVFIKQASYATDYHITLDGHRFSYSTDKNDEKGKLSSTTIAIKLAEQIRAGGVYVCDVTKSSLWIRRANNTTFIAMVDDSRSNSHISITTGKVQRFSDLPLVAPHGFITEITGDQSSSFDNYFVKFETNNNNGFDSGVWVETVKPGVPHTLNSATMPHALIRKADGTFSFETLEWGKRTCGDADSAPNPSFVGRRFSAIFFYRNRLGLLANENCILSESGKFFNFFPTTVTTIVDSDVIDAAASHTKAASLYHAAVFSEGLILFSDQTQFLLEHDDNLSIKTVAIKPITEFECSTKAQPIGAGKNIFFATTRGQFGGVREYYVEGDSALTDATDITSHVPHYIKGNIHKLVGSTNEDYLLALSDVERKSIAFYKYFWNGPEKLQSAWSKWSFTGDVLSAVVLNSKLLLIIQYADGVYLEQLNIEPGYTDIDAPFEYAIDRKLTEQAIILDYDAETKSTTLTYPYTLTSAPIVVSRHTAHQKTSAHPAGIIYNILSYSENTAIVKGDLRAVCFFTGIPFISRYVFSKQLLREESGNNGGKITVIEGRLQLRLFTLGYSDTGYFEAHITPEYRQTDVRKFTGRLIGHGGNILSQPTITSGSYRFPVLCKADAVSISLVSSSFLPFQITSAGWEGFYHVRSQRV